MEDEKLKKIIKEKYELRNDIKNMFDSDNIKKIIDNKENVEMKKFKILPALSLLIIMFFVGNGLALALGYDNIYTKIYEYFIVPEDEKLENISLEGMEEEIDTSGIKSTLGYKVQFEDEIINTLTRENNHDIYNISDMYKLEIYFTESNIYNILNLNNNTDTLLVPTGNFYGPRGQLLETKSINKNNVNEYITTNNKAKTIETVVKDEVYTYGDNTTASIIKEFTIINVENKNFVIEETYVNDTGIIEGWKSRVNSQLKTIEIYEEKNNKEIIIIDNLFGKNNENQNYYRD